MRCKSDMWREDETLVLATARSDKKERREIKASVIRSLMKALGGNVYGSQRTPMQLPSAESGFTRRKTGCELKRAYWRTAS